MSELLEAAAKALGVPTAIVRRSAEARAAETGAAIDEILAAWAGGEAMTPAPPPPVTTTEEPEPEPSPPSPDATSPPASSPREAPAAAPPPPRPESVRGAPPVLVGVSDRPLSLFAGAFALAVGLLLVAVAGPAMEPPAPGARSSQVELSDLGAAGRSVYLEAGCAGCHTQMVRPVVADIGLGPVTLADSNQVLGTVRFGPDLSDAGTRLTAGQIEATITGLGGHPVAPLSAEDLGALVAYLVESRSGS